MAFWMCIQIKYTSASLEYKGQKQSVLRSRKDLCTMLNPLINDTEASGETKAILKALLASKSVRMFEDALTSPYYGKNTKRLNLVFPKKVIIPCPTLAKTKQEEINAVGKRLKVSSCSFISNIKLTLSTTDVDDADIPSLLKKNPSWFIGDIGLENLSEDPKKSGESRS